MLYNSYDELVKGVSDWLGRDDLAAEIPTFIYCSELDAQRTLHLRLIDAIAQDNFVAGQEWIELPEDFVEGRYLRIEADPTRRVNIVSVDKYEDVKNHQATVEPSAAFVHGSRLYCARTAQSALGYTLFYKAGIRHLSNENPSNFLLVSNPDLLLYGSLHHAAGFIGGDERAQGWNQEYERIKAEVRAQEWRARTSMGPLQIRPDTLPPRAGGVRS